MNMCLSLPPIPHQIRFKSNTGSLGNQIISHSQFAMRESSACVQPSNNVLQSACTCTDCTLLYCRTGPLYPGLSATPVGHRVFLTPQGDGTRRDAMCCVASRTLAGSAHSDVRFGHSFGGAHFGIQLESGKEKYICEWNQ